MPHGQDCDSRLGARKPARTHKSHRKNQTFCIGGVNASRMTSSIFINKPNDPNKPSIQIIFFTFLIRISAIIGS